MLLNSVCLYLGRLKHDCCFKRKKKNPPGSQAEQKERDCGEWPCVDPGPAACDVHAFENRQRRRVMELYAKRGVDTGLEGPGWAWLGPSP